ncbi:MAG: hypothetical protein J6Z36_03615 [Clostridia bacterium]|nr:hypothetical protein [Clostridia bacterium]
MTKTNKIGKLPILLAVWCVLLAAGLALFFVLGFNPGASISDSKTVTVSYDAYVTLSDDLTDEFQKICQDEFKAASVNVIEWKTVTTSSGGETQFRVAANTANDKLESVGQSIATKVAASQTTLKNASLTVTIHENEAQALNNFVARAAIAAAVIVALAGVYVFVRYSFSMGYAALIAGVADVLIMLALTLIFRVPVTATLAVAAAFAALYSAILSVVSFGAIRPLLKSEEYAELAADEAVEKASKATRKYPLIVSCAAVVLFAALAIFGGEALRWFAVSVILGVLASTYSAVCVAPALVACFKGIGKKISDNSAEKQRVARLEEEKARAEKRDKKKE